jgi:hypothetical protein
MHATQDRADDYMAGEIGRLDNELAAMKTANAQAIASAVEAGILRAVSNPALWEAAGTAMRVQAQSAAGGWLLGGLRGLATRAAWIIAVVAGVYALGGWAAVLALIKAQGGAS